MDLLVVIYITNLLGSPLCPHRFPWCVFHICNFDICHETQQATDKYKNQNVKIRVSFSWLKSRAINYIPLSCPSLKFEVSFLWLKKKVANCPTVRSWSRWGKNSKYKNKKWPIVPQSEAKIASSDSLSRSSLKNQGELKNCAFNFCVPWTFLSLSATEMVPWSW